ncbi:MAG: efflux RND transporter periplasmic adaptor subunit [candidate division Zixibacteria bacterium]
MKAIKLSIFRLVLIITVLVFAFWSLSLTDSTSNIQNQTDPHENDQKTDDDHKKSELGDDHDLDAQTDDGHDHTAEESEGDEHDEEEEGVIELSEEAIKMAGINLSTVIKGRLGNSLDLPGEITFNEDQVVHISPRFEGIAREARFTVGDYVNAGDIVAVVESNESMSPYNIKSPISGWIIVRHISKGEFVSAENSIFVIVDLSTVWVNLAVYPKDADRVRPGMKASIEAIGSDIHAEGTIEYITPILDVNTRSITARVVLPNPDNQWRPGTFVHAAITTDYGKPGLLVEKDAVQILDNEKIVFIAEVPGHFIITHIETGEYDSKYIKVLSGLEQGMQYVADGAFELKAKLVTGSLGGHAGHGH